MWKLWPYVPKIVRRLSKELQEERWQRERLETITRRQQLAINELAADVERLSDRLTATQGRLLGGGKGRPARAQGQLRIDDIPHGDKEALRAHFKLHPPKKGTNDETEH